MFSHYKILLCIDAFLQVEFVLFFLKNEPILLKLCLFGILDPLNLDFMQLELLFFEEFENLAFFEQILEL